MAKPTFRQTVSIALIGGAVALLATWLFGTLRFTFLDEDDRPPIIVHNGSMNFTPVPILGVPGHWSLIPDSKSYTHLHGKKGPSKFTVHVGNAETSGQCDEDKYKNIRWVRLTHSVGGTVRVDVDRRSDLNLMVVIESENVTATHPAETLIVGAAGGYLSRAELYDRVDLTNVTPKAVCTFLSSPPAKLLIEQKRPGFFDSLGF